MGLRINTNISSLQAQNQLSKSGKNLSKSLERLSSGLRINSGKDDVVGLLTSEVLRSQIRGIGVAKNNLSNAQSLLGVADGALSQLTDIAQQIREKVVQAADDSINAADRSNLTTSVADLQNEYTRLVNAAKFNGVDLLNGTFSNKSFQAGPNAGDTVSLSLSDTRSSAIGQVASLTSTAASSGAASLGAATFAGPTSIVINGVSVGSSAFTDDGVSTTLATESALAYVNAVNSVSGESGVVAYVNANEVTLNDYTAGAALEATDVFIVNGVTIAHGAVTNNDAGAAAFVATLNGYSSQTGVTFSLDATANTISMSAADGRNIAIDVDTTAANASARVLGFDYGGTPASDTSGVTVYKGTFDLVADEAWTLSGTGISATTSVSVGGDTLADLDVSSATDAAAGILIMDSTIRQLQNRRSDVGSKSIRLDVAVAELNTRQENLSSAESVIRDVDIASETANLSKQQILQQAGVTVLARANQLPQLALSLLQG